MKAVTKITFLDENREKFFGDGPARLLRGIEESGSLRSAAISMDMAYSKALKILKNAEAALGFPLTTRTIGGKSGGGSLLTAEAKIFLAQYDAYMAACTQANRQLFRQFFPTVGCVIMASGLGKRFGGNKLMADFNGKPMILHALQSSEGLSEHRVVVTRHEDVAALCRTLGVRVVLHDLPHRSDTVRLGLEALGDVDGCLFLPADQPLLRRETVEKLIRNWSVDQDSIMRPCCGDTPGAPVLFPHWAFPELLSLPEGKGGSLVLKDHPEKITALNIDDPYELMDADTPETLKLLLKQRK